RQPQPRARGGPRHEHRRRRGLSRRGEADQASLRGPAVVGWASSGGITDNGAEGTEGAESIGLAGKPLLAARASVITNELSLPRPCPSVPSVRPMRLSVLN